MSDITIDEPLAPAIHAEHVDAAMVEDSERIEDAFYHAAKGPTGWDFRRDVPASRTDRQVALTLANYCRELWLALTPEQRAAFGPREIGQDMRDAMERRWDAYTAEQEGE